jgi:DNA-binding MarR family transcriptional regulator
MQIHSELEDPSKADIARLARTLVWNGAQLSRWGAVRTMQAPLALTLTQISVLYLARHGITTPGAIARQLLVTAKAITYAVDRLEELALITREADRHDRRRTQLVLTDRGLATSLEIEADTLMPLQRLLETLSAGDIATLRRAANLTQSLLAALPPAFEPDSA